MLAITKFRRRLGRLGAAGVGLALVTSGLAAQARTASGGVSPPPAFTVDGEVALHSLMSLSDGHLQKLADVLTMLANTDVARSCDWETIRGQLADAARVNVPAVLWFAMPDGGYWTVTQGRVDATLADRPYFPRLLAGETVIGNLVVSHSTNRNTAIVAVPVFGQEHEVVGMLGASVHLDTLAAVLRAEMGGLRDSLLFFAIDSQGLGALNSDPTLIFTEPLKIGDVGMQRAFRQILSGPEGVVTYDFRGARRTVLYRKSPVTGWSYGFGMIHR